MVVEALLSLLAVAAPLPSAGQVSTQSSVPEPTNIAETRGDIAELGSPFGKKAVSDEVLQNQRGGIRLPNGIDVALTVETRTAVNGAIVLRTVMKLDQGAPVVAVYAPEDGKRVEITVMGRPENADAPPTIAYDRQGGVRITRTGTAPTVAVASGPAAALPPDADGLEEIDISNPVATHNGVIAGIGQTSRPGVELKASDLHVVHLFSGAYGSAIANSANNRVIDTQTTISIDLRNAGPDVLGSAMFRVESVALSAMAIRM